MDNWSLGLGGLGSQFDDPSLGLTQFTTHDNPEQLTSDTHPSHQIPTATGFQENSKPTKKQVSLLRFENDDQKAEARKVLEDRATELTTALTNTLGFKDTITVEELADESLAAQFVSALRDANPTDAALLYWAQELTSIKAQLYFIDQEGWVDHDTKRKAFLASYKNTTPDDSKPCDHNKWTSRPPLSKVPLNKLEKLSQSASRREKSGVTLELVLEAIERARAAKASSVEPQADALLAQPETKREISKR